MSIRRSLPVVAALTLSLLACTSEPAPRPSEGAQRTPEAPTATSGRSKETRTGVASFIAQRFEGSKTASGVAYDGNALVAAHPTYPMGTILRVTNQENGRTVEVKVIDRSAAGGPIVDLSMAAAKQLDFIRKGTVTVTTDVVEWGPERRGK